jgi:hypothetical protein
VTTAHPGRPETERYVDDSEQATRRSRRRAAGAGAVIAPAQLVGFWSRLAALDEQIAARHAAGHGVDDLLEARLIG